MHVLDYFPFVLSKKKYFTSKNIKILSQSKHKRNLENNLGNKNNYFSRFLN